MSVWREQAPGLADAIDAALAREGLPSIQAKADIPQVLFQAKVVRTQVAVNALISQSSVRVLVGPATPIDPRERALCELARARRKW